MNKAKDQLKDMWLDAIFRLDLVFSLVSDETLNLRQLSNGMRYLF